MSARKVKMLRRAAQEAMVKYNLPSAIHRHFKRNYAELSEKERYTLGKELKDHATKSRN